MIISNVYKQRKLGVTPAFRMTFGLATVHSRHHPGGYLSPCGSKDKQKG